MLVLGNESCNGRCERGETTGVSNQTKSDQPDQGGGEGGERVGACVCVRAVERWHQIRSNPIKAGRRGGRERESVCVRAAERWLVSVTEQPLLVGRTTFALLEPATRSRRGRGAAPMVPTLADPAEVLHYTRTHSQTPLVHLLTWLNKTGLVRASW